MGCIYKITNLVNGKIYIGKTTRTIEERLAQHFQDARANRGYKIHKAITKYGSDNFIIEELYRSYSEEILNKLEIFLIKKYDCIRNGYNLNTGGQGGRNELACKKLVEYTKNKIWTEEDRKRVSLQHKGKKISKDNIAKMAAARKPFTPERRALLAQRMRERNPMSDPKFRDKMRNGVIAHYERNKVKN